MKPHTGCLSQVFECLFWLFSYVHVLQRWSTCMTGLSQLFATTPMVVKRVSWYPRTPHVRPMEKGT